MKATDYQFCDDFSTGCHAPTEKEKAAYAAADSLGLSMTFEFNRALQGASHALAGRPCAYPSNSHYTAGYEAATA